MNTLFIDATIRTPKESRTHQLASAYLDSLMSKNDGSVHHLQLNSEDLSPLTAADAALRGEVIRSGDFAHPLAKYGVEFAQADHIVMAAPYWDLSFPALLKIYIEYICATGITFAYGEEGIISLCKAKTLTYITTSGGEIYEGQNLGYDYIAALAKTMFHIPEIRFLSAQMLDVEGMDIDAIMAAAKAEAMQLAQG